MGPERVVDRLAELSPQRRKLVEDLLSGKRAASAEITTAFEEEALQSFGSPVSRSKAGTRKFYNSINQQLDQTIFGACSAFLNYGYVEDDSPQISQINLPSRMFNRPSVKLVLEVIGDCSLDGKNVLDVGCGRGGTLSLVNQFFHAPLKVGIDLSSSAIAFCHKAHSLPDTYFMEGDAEQLSFCDGAFAVVLNVESSHSYPNISCFYTSVRRVLLPGGHFLYTDLFPPNIFDQHEEELRAMGFAIEQKRDITRNVLKSCHQNARNRSRAFAGTSEQSVIQDFLSTPRSTMFDAMESGQLVYRIVKLKRI